MRLPSGDTSYGVPQWPRSIGGTLIVTGGPNVGTASRLHCTATLCSCPRVGRAARVEVRRWRRRERSRYSRYAKALLVEMNARHLSAGLPVSPFMPSLDHPLQDVRFAVRQLRKHPGFTSTALGVLALGMCASVSIFAFVDAALLKPLPYTDPSRLIGVFESVKMFPQSNLSWPDYLDWKARNTSLASLNIYDRDGFMLTTPAGPEMVRVARVSDGFFHTLGVAPMLGRDFRGGENEPAAPRVALVSYAAWQQRFGGRDDVIAQTVVLERMPYTIVGVLPRDFHFAPAEPAEFWTAFHADSGCDERRGCHGLYGVGRLKNGVSIQAALADLKSVARQLEQEYPDSNRDQGAAVAPLKDVIVGDIGPILLTLLAG